MARHPKGHTQRSFPGVPSSSSAMTKSGVHLLEEPGSWPSPEMPSGDQPPLSQWQEWPFVVCQNHPLWKRLNPSPYSSFLLPVWVFSP